MEFEQLIGKRALGIAQKDDYGIWAESLLSENIESENVAILAGICLDKYPDTEELEKYFQKSIQDLNLSLPNQMSALKNYALVLCEQIVNGEIKPKAGLDVCCRFYSESDYDAIYSIWDELSEDIWFIENENHCIFNTGLTRENVDVYIQRVAQQFIQLLQIKLPDNFFRLCICQNCHFLGASKLEQLEKPYLPKSLFRLIWRRQPHYHSVCAKCHEPFPLNMSDYLARQQFLELFCHDAFSGSASFK